MSIPSKKPKRYRLYIDESGDHTYVAVDNPEKRYLGLTGCFIDDEHYRMMVHPRLEALKQNHFPHNPDEPIVFHRRDIIKCSGAFWRLKDERCQLAFNSDILNLFSSANYGVISVVIDKKAHIDRYGRDAFHPCHYCLLAMLERYCGFLNFYNAIGDVMAERRGKVEDGLLKEAYQAVFNNGTQWRRSEFFNKRLTSKDLKVKPKDANIAGLQLADLLAYPCREEILLENRRIADPGSVFSKEICQRIADKYNRHVYEGRVTGYGKVFLK